MTQLVQCAWWDGCKAETPMAEGERAWEDGWGVVKRRPFCPEHRPLMRNAFFRLDSNEPVDVCPTCAEGLRAQGVRVKEGDLAEDPYFAECVCGLVREEVPPMPWMAREEYAAFVKARPGVRAMLP